MKRRVRYHALAQRDFVAAAAWSQSQWGAHLTRRYLLTIEAQVQRIVENPMLGSDADLPRAGQRKIIAGRHTVFYMVDESEVQIVRIMGPHQDHANALGLR